ncbi:ice-binding protein [Flavobacterium sp. LB1P71]|uniref:ice-binding protein n=1 Tax=unclassified Flavobacterium TaxID=196869 RepID=UPI003AACD40B
MKFKNALPTLALLLVVFMSGCNNDTDEDLTANSAAVGKSDSSTSHINALNETYIIEPKIGSLNGVNLGIAGDFAILSKTGITDVYKSTITGDIGSSPITGAAILVRCTEVVGTIYTVDAAGPLPCSVTNATRLTTAIGDMQTAYTDAAGRTNPDFLNLGAGNIGGKTLTPGLYKWTSALNIPTDITISGNPTDVFIFQVAGTLKLSSAVRMTLTGGVQSKNIFWVVSDAVTCGTTSHFEGNILGMTGINLQTEATINGRLLAQTAVTLQMNAVTQPQ